MPHRRPRAFGPPSLTVEVTYDSWVAVVTVVGDVDCSSVAKLRAAVDEVAHTGQDLLIDLTHCPFIDSTGLGQVLRAQGLARAQDAAFAVVCGDGGIPARVLELVCGGTIPLHRTLGEARQAMHHVADDLDEEVGGSTAAPGSP